MRYPKVLCLIFLCSILFYACGEKDKSQQNPQDELISDALEDSRLDIDEDCPGGLMVICNSGLSFAPLGLKIADLHAIGIEEVEEADSLDYEMGYVRLNRSFSFSNGFILLEGDALTEEGASAEEISDSNLSRIRIEAKGFKTPDGVHTGMSVSELSELYSDEDLSVLSFASFEQFRDNPRYQFLILNPEKYPNITYLLPDPGNQLFEQLENKEDIKLSQLPKETMISSIVISV
ncbi:MAG: hypothetical protein R8P61_18610 [Bacteroidia bacterium]|nr:hypothetical protein [Bacteroidia bacterium]